MFTVALTGGIGCGKSTACSLFEQHGTPVIDTDQIARQLVQPGEPALLEIKEQFGNSILLSDGRLNRHALAARVFADDNKRKQLEAILHPRIRDEVRIQISRLNGSYCIVAIPLLFETEQQKSYDRVLVIDCEEEQQLDRTLQRDKRSADEVFAIMRTQVTREYRLAHADDIIDNSLDMAHLKQQVQVLHTQYKVLAEQSIR